MRIEEQCTLDLAPEMLWNFIQDVPAVAKCVPGVEEIKALDDSTFAGSLAVKVGPVSARFVGKAIVQKMDRATGQASMRVEGQDSRIASQVHGTFHLQTKEVDQEKTSLAVMADLNILGVIGQLGHWVIKRKARDLMQEFARHLTREAQKQP